MHITQVFHSIIQSDTEDHWQRFEYRAVNRAVFKQDVNLRIVCNYEEDKLVEDFKENWATKHSNSHATSYAYRIYYGSTFIAYVVLVSIDGGRALLPLPNTETMRPDLLAFRVAEIFDRNQIHEYMSRSGLKYPEGT